MDFVIFIFYRKLVYNIELYNKTMQDDVTFFIYDSDGTPNESAEDLRYKVSSLRVIVRLHSLA